MNCMICELSLAGWDEAASTHHINQCLDGNNTASTSTGRPSSLHSANFVQEKTCPICFAELATPDEQAYADHVQACSLALENPQSAFSGAEENGDASRCPCCFLAWADMDIGNAERDAHVEECVQQQACLASDEEEDDQSSPSRSNGNDTVPSTEATSLSNGFGKLRSSTWRKQPSSNFKLLSTPSLIPVLSTLLSRASSSPQSLTKSAVLCTPHVWHVKSGFGDFGWGCGYRNAQMVSSALRHVEQYRELLLGRDGVVDNGVGTEAEGGGSQKRKTSPNALRSQRSVEQEKEEVAEIPSIAELQAIAEKAWAEGYDKHGSAHFGGKLVGSRKWIGTSEVYVMFTYLGIRCTIIDFPSSRTSPGSVHSALTNWVFEYFKLSTSPSSSSSSSTTASNGTGGHHPKDAFAALMSSNGSNVRVAEEKMPLYLQHQGHSRTIVGVEMTKGGELNLLLFDPGKKIPTDLRSGATSSSTSVSSAPKRPRFLPSAPPRSSSAPPDIKHLSLFRVNLRSLSKKDEYQILRIETEGGALSGAEKRERRELTSLRIT